MDGIEILLGPKSPSVEAFTFPLEAELTDELAKETGLHEALRKIADRLVRQYNKPIAMAKILEEKESDQKPPVRRSPAIGVRFTSLTFSYVLDR